MTVTDSLVSGTVLSGYRIGSTLGRGGMGAVYLAEDPNLQRKVALKVISPEQAESRELRDRFLAETQLAASIDHPNIVPIYAAGEASGTLYIAMRYVPGGDLKARIREQPLDPDDAIGVLAQIASALDAAHARGLVHRDVKPSNVLLDAGSGMEGVDHAYLADFGLSERIGGESAGSRPGAMVGTIDYVAPEQIAGQPVDWRADIYALGCLLYECLTGSPPFPRGTDLQVVFAHLEADPPSAEAQRAGLPAGLDRVIARAMAKDPDDRYSSCREFARAASAVLVDEATRQLTDVAHRAAAGRDQLSDTEAELAERVMAVQSALSHRRALSRKNQALERDLPGMCPFKGLASFGVGDAEYYFGRERLVAQLATRLIRSSLIAIVGASGSGKSSLLQAGLMPALSAGVLPGSARWPQILVRPGDRPAGRLRGALGLAPDRPLAEALDSLGEDERLVVAVDQLEEVFTAGCSEQERSGFLSDLNDLAADRQGRAVVVTAVRADYYGHLADYPDFAEVVGANHVLVGPMHASQLRRAVELPAARSGLDVEPELVDALIDDVAGEPGALPLLSTALVELWVQRSDSQLTLASYRSSGGVGGAVARLAEATYLGIPEAQRPLVRTMMLRLVGEGEDPSAPVRRRASLTEFDLQHNADADSVLEALTGGRLVTVHEGAVEVAHEALLREWPRLRDWIDEDAQARHVRGRITEAAAEWDAAGRDPAELYRGARLAAVLDLQGDRLAELNALERAFVDESRAAAEVETGRARRTNRRLRGLLTGVAVLLVAAVLVGTLAFEQRTQAQEAGTMQLAHSLGARALVTEDLDLSMLLARQAVELHDSPQTRGYLLNGLLRHPAAIGTMHTNATPGAQQALAVSPDGATIAIADESTGLFFFDARTFEPIGEPLDIPSIVSLAFNPDGRTLAYGVNTPEFASSSIGLLDASTHGLVRESTMTARDRPLHISYSPDGSRLMVIAGTGIWGEQNYITIRDAETLAHEVGPLAPPNFSGRWVYGSLDPAAELLSDNKTLLTTSLEGSLTWWDLETGQAVRTQPIDEGYGAMAVSDDGTTIAVGSDGGLQLIDERTSHARVAPVTASITFLQISPDGRTLATTGTDGSVTLWDSATLTQAAVLRGHSSALGPPEFSPDGRTLYTAGADGTAIAWDIGGDRGTVRRFSFPDEYAFGEAEFGPAEQATGKYSPDGSLIAVRLAAEGVGLVDADDLAPAGKPLLPTGGQVAGFAFSPDGRLLAAFTNDTATIWNVESRSLIREPFRVDPDTNGIGFSHDSSTLLVAGQGIDLFDVASGAELGHLGDVQLAGKLAFSPTKAHVAFVRGYSVLEVWDTDERVLVARGDPVGGYLGSLIAFSPDGRLVAAGGVADPYVRIWDAQTAELVRVIRSNVGSSVQAIGFSADSAVIGMGGQEGYAALWDVESGSPLGSRIAVGRRDVALDFSPDGSRLLTTLSNGQAAVWDVDPQSWADRACAIANRSLTQEEWDEYLPGRPYEPACAG